MGRIYVQPKVGPYRPDILIDCDFQKMLEPLRLIVECDGPWHDKSNQHHADRRRDRWLQSQGYTVLRFPTNEINARGMDSAYKCAEEVGEVIDAHVKRAVRSLRRQGNFVIGGLAAGIIRTSPTAPRGASAHVVATAFDESRTP